MLTPVCVSASNMSGSLMTSHFFSAAAQGAVVSGPDKIGRTFGPLLCQVAGVHSSCTVRATSAPATVWKEEVGIWRTTHRGIQVLNLFC